MSTPLNPFDALDNVQHTYRSYVETFQNVDDETINSWIENRIATGKVLWKEPFVQLNQRFQYGETLEEFVANNKLHKGIIDVFTGVGGDPIEPYKHQTEAIQSIQSGNNTIVSTGTGSGKSFAFGIPIVSHCLEAKERGEDGIKAVIVYPMNALANSQYEDFAERLDGTGLRLGLYTGDTPYDPDDEADFLQQFGRKEAFDSEVISREEMQDDPPDILMTNYVMLDLILTRHEDKDLFPDRHAGALQYLVLDEIHTYTGQQGADVAALVRRLREHTDADDLTCIGTSATVQSEEGLDADEEIAKFAERIFGEDVDPDHVVNESHYSLAMGAEEPLPADVKVTEADIRDFDGTLDGAIALANLLLDRPLDSTQVSSKKSLGEVLLNHPSVEFLQSELNKASQQIHPTEEDDEGLVERYIDQLRPNSTPQQASRELQAALLAGTIGTTDIQGEQQPIFIPKLHSFFSQGSGLVACLTDDTLSDDPPHLSDAGDLVCPDCATEYDRHREAFGLSFCRSCGQEYYTVTRTEDGYLQQREVSNLGVEDDETPGYIMRGEWDEEQASLPDEWLDNDGLLRDTWSEAEPQPATYCPEHNRLTEGHQSEGQLQCGCYANQGVQVTWVEAPFLFCPECGVHHTRMGRAMETSKLFTFGTVGRSTATDVLVGSTMQELPDEQQKTIAFSDNRQDTALQAAHINNLYQRIKFRRALYHAIDENGGSAVLNNLGDETFEILGENDALPSGLSNGLFGVEQEDKANYSDYLLFHTLLELRKSQQRGQQSLEDVGLIDISYSNLDKLAEMDEYWEDIPVLEDADPEVRLEYSEGFLDLFRRASAIDHDYIVNFGDFLQKTIKKLDDDVLFHKQQRFRFPQGFSDTANTSGTEKIRRLTHPRSRHVKWTTRALDIDDSDEAAEVINGVKTLFSDEQLRFIVEKPVYRGRKAFVLRSGTVRIQTQDASHVSVCPKCKTVVNRERLDTCINYSCGNVEPEAGDLTTSYFHDLYVSDFDDTVDILAAEHSGQIEGDVRKDIETRFREGGELNTIVSTPTMELGIDIGNLSNVMMRNVPPNPSNYAQRSGRAGRQNQSSLVTTFCGSGFGGSSHDQYFYQRPERIISGEISPPTFLLNNQDLVRAHINALVLEVIDTKFYGHIEQILDIDPQQNEYPIIPSYREDLESAIENNRDTIIDAVKGAFSRELQDAAYQNWLTDDYIADWVDNFVANLDRAFDSWRSEYNDLKRELRRLGKLIEAEGGSRTQHREHEALAERLKDMREGGRRFYSYQYLRSQGFLPNYGFPRSSCTLRFTTREDDIQRDESKAIREFAPGNSVYYMGQRYGVRYARPKTQATEPLTRHKIVCPDCETILMGEDAETAAACPACGTSFDGVHPNANTMELPDQRAYPEENITSDDEERRREGYDINPYYEQTNAVQHYSLETEDGTLADLTYEPNARIVTVNSGIRGREDDDELSGFALCTQCNRWLTSEGQIDSHLDGHCYANAEPEDIRRNIELFTEGGHDTITVTTGLPIDLEPEDAQSFYTTLKESLFQGILVAFDLDEAELETFLKPAPNNPDQLSIVIHETSEGGAGALNALMDGSRFRQAMREALDVLHETDPDGCEQACYECLMSYYNQREHALLDRHKAIPWLKAALDGSLSKSADDSSDEEERLEELLDDCESELEQDILKRVHEEGFTLPSSVQKTIYDDGEPVAQADLFYDRSVRAVAIFVDGPDHDKEHIKQDDRRKRRRLREMNFRVISVRDPNDVPEVWSTI